MGKEWFKVENLEKMQEEEIARYDKGEIDNRNDFHSYRLLNEGKDFLESGIAEHNVTGRFADAMADLIYGQLEWYCKKHSFPNCPGNLGDLGGVLAFLPTG